MRIRAGQRKRFTWFGLSLPLAAVLCAVLALQAQADTYQVNSCVSDPKAADNAWTISTSSLSPLVTKRNCPGSDDNAGLSIVDPQGGITFSNAEAKWTFSSAPQTTIRELALYRYLGKRFSDNWYVYGAFGDGSAIDKDCQIDNESGSCFVSGFLKLTAPASSANIIYGVMCKNERGCDNGDSNIHNAWAVIHSSTITLDDPVSPTVSAPTGSLLDSPDWNGSRSVTVSASDNTGIRYSEVYIDGVLVSSQFHPCDYTKVVPCDNINGTTHMIDASRYSDGDHRVKVAALDAADNRSYSQEFTVHVRNSSAAGGGNDPVAAPVKRSIGLRITHLKLRRKNRLLTLRASCSRGIAYQDKFTVTYKPTHVRKAIKRRAVCRKGVIKAELRLGPRSRRGGKAYISYPGDTALQSAQAVGKITVRHANRA